jgi:hypothetical protein
VKIKRLEKASDCLIGTEVRISQQEDGIEERCHEYDGHVGKIIGVDDGYLEIDGIDDFVFAPQDCLITEKEERKDKTKKVKLFLQKVKALVPKEREMSKMSFNELVQKVNNGRSCTGTAKLTGGEKMGITGKLGNLSSILMGTAKEQAKNAGAATVTDVLTEVVDKHTGGALGFLKNVPLVGDIQSLVLTGGAFGLAYLAQGHITQAGRLLSPLKLALNGKFYEFSKDIFGQLQPIVDELCAKLDNHNLLGEKGDE